MRKFTLFLALMVAMVTSAVAQIDTNKEYRLKYTVGTQELYMNIGTSRANTHGHVNVVAFAEDVKMKKILLSTAEVTIVESLEEETETGN